MTATFQRARSHEQREMRRHTVLTTASAMLDEMPVAEVTLNELSRRVGLAKSNILRYFDSREAVLLELLDAGWVDWLAELSASIRSVRQGQPPSERGHEVVRIFVESLARRRVLTDLLSAQAAVLERNVSPDVAAKYKRGSVAHVSTLAGFVHEAIPELPHRVAERLCAAFIMAASAVWTYSQPSKSMADAYLADPSLEKLSLKFEPTLRHHAELLFDGALARSQNA